MFKNTHQYFLECDNDTSGLNAINTVAAFDLPSTSSVLCDDYTPNIHHLANAVLTYHAVINSKSRPFESSLSGVNEDNNDNNTSVLTLLTYFALLFTFTDGLFQNIVKWVVKLSNRN